jgi:hypothetical protein
MYESSSAWAGAAGMSTTTATVNPMQALQAMTNLYVC